MILLRNAAKCKVLLLALLWAGVAGALGYELGFSSRPQIVYREPAENELVVINGCVVSACQFLASVRAQHELDPNFWSRVMLVRYENSAAGHAYCVWETDGHIFGYDRNNGGYPIPTHDRNPKAIAGAMATELGKVLHKEMRVARAEFIEPRATKLYAF
jgi:hypothetical protein